MKPLDVISRPFAYSQRPLLNPREFAAVLADRGLLLSVDALEVLHQTRLLAPLYAVRRPRWDIDQRRRNRGYADGPFERTWWVPTRGPDLRSDFEAGAVKDGAAVRFRPWSKDVVQMEWDSVRRRDYLYSRYQAISASWLAPLFPLVGRASRDLSRWERSALKHGRDRAETDRALVTLLIALEPLYLPRILRTYRYSDPSIVDEYEQYARSMDPVALLDELGRSSQEVYDTASRLLVEADGADPLRDWLPLVRQVQPSRWDKLRGSALLAVDMRVAAELLLGLYEDLQARSAAPPFPNVPKRMPHELNSRLKADRAQLDDALMTYGISPYPAVLLSLEGATEMAIAPLVMDLLGIPRRDTLVRLIDAGGEDRDHWLLASYVALPKLGPRQGDLAPFLRPPTRYVIAVDGDRSFQTPAARDAERDKWVRMLFAGLPSDMRTTEALEDLQDMVSVQAWADGLDFERAHFTDAELARGLMSTGHVPSELSADALTRDLAERRARSENIARVWRGWPTSPTKPELALALWPVLEQRIAAALKSDTAGEVPIARVVIHAFELARRTPRGHAVLRVGGSIVRTGQYPAPTVDEVPASE